MNFRLNTVRSSISLVSNTTARVYIYVGSCSQESLWKYKFKAEIFYYQVLTLYASHSLQRSKVYWPARKPRHFHFQSWKQKTHSLSLRSCASWGVLAWNVSHQACFDMLVSSLLCGWWSFTFVTSWLSPFCTFVTLCLRSFIDITPDIETTVLAFTQNLRKP